MNSVQGYRAHASQAPALCLRHSLLGPTGPLACLVASFAAPSYMLMCSIRIRVVKTGVMVIKGPIDPTDFGRNKGKAFSIKRLSKYDWVILPIVMPSDGPTY